MNGDQRWERTRPPLKFCDCMHFPRETQNPTQNDVFLNCQSWPKHQKPNLIYSISYRRLHSGDRINQPKIDKDKSRASLTYNKRTTCLNESKSLQTESSMSHGFLFAGFSLHCCLWFDYSWALTLTLIGWIWTFGTKLAETSTTTTPTGTEFIWPNHIAAGFSVGTCDTSIYNTLLIKVHPTT